MHLRVVAGYCGTGVPPVGMDRMSIPTGFHGRDARATSDARRQLGDAPVVAPVARISFGREEGRGSTHRTRA